MTAASRDDHTTDDGPAEEHRLRLRTRRRRIALAAAAMVGLALVDPVVGSLQQQQRQQHLAVAFDEPKQNIEPGDALSVLQIPSIGLSQVVVEGSDSSQLRSGPGHVVGTSLPGAEGDTVILGHASRYGGPFAELRTLTEGARIAIKSRSGFVQLYKVTSTGTLADRNPVLVSSADERLTLITSEDAWWPSRRVVVVAEPDTAAAAPPTVPVEVRIHRPPADALDARPLDVRALAVMIGLAVLIGSGSRALARRYRRATVIAVLAPAALLIVVSVLHLVDLVGPSTW